jgi:hypothetical protein
MMDKKQVRDEHESKTRANIAAMLDRPSETGQCSRGDQSDQGSFGWWPKLASRTRTVARLVRLVR